MIIPIRCFTCGKIMADKIDYYVAEVEKQKAAKAGKEPDAQYKNFDEFHSKEILDGLGLTRYCCRRNLISNVDLMHII
jgi:DNA-directed RNA polymerase subunit N (RpoN/RPB10)